MPFSKASKGHLSLVGNYRRNYVYQYSIVHKIFQFPILQLNSECNTGHQVEQILNYQKIIPEYICVICSSLCL